jgi:hypothetical protein
VVVYHQPWRQAPLRLMTITCFFFQLNTSDYSYYVISSLTRGQASRLQLLLALASAVILGSESRILLHQIRDSPNLEGQVRVFLSPRNRVFQLYLQALGFLFVVPYDSQRYGVGNRPRLHNKYILAIYMCDYRRGMDWWMDLMVPNTHHLKLRITITLSLISTLYKSLHAESSPACSVFTSRCLVTAPNNGGSSASVPTSLLSGWYPTAELRRHLLQNSIHNSPPYNLFTRTE